MRTTINLEPDVLQAARKIARARSVTLGKALSELARKGLQARSPSGRPGHFPVFDVKPGAAPITPDDVRRDEDEG